jgi:hypothetical protein
MITVTLKGYQQWITVVLTSKDVKNKGQREYRYSRAHSI